MSSVSSDHLSESGDGIFVAFVDLTLKNLSQSLEDAKNRYELGKAEEDPKPSANWAVTNQAVPTGDGTSPEKQMLLSEEVVIWLNVGEERLEIVPGNRHAVIQASALINSLEEMKKMVEGFLTDRSSEQAQEFHRIAIEQAKPMDPPEGGSEKRWEYDRDTDRYIAI